MKEIKILLFCSIIIMGVQLNAQNSIAIYKTDVAPVIDGTVDDLWSKVHFQNIETPFQNEMVSLTEKVTFKALWDNKNIYLLVSVPDDDFYPSVESGLSSWQSDIVELYFDVNSYKIDGRGPNYSYGHYQFAPTYNQNQNSTYKFSYSVTNNKDYTVEYAIPFSSLIDNNGYKLNPETRNCIGFDITINDLDQGGSNSRRRISWSNGGEIDENWNNMDDAGELFFIGTKNCSSPDTIYEEGEICFGETYYFEGRELNKTGLYSFLTDTCSIKILKLNVLPPKDIIEFYKTICRGEEYNFYGHAYSDSGVFELPAGNCSLKRLHLSWSAPKDTAHFAASICEGSSYYFEGQYYTEAGIHEIAKNCHLTQLNLSFIPPTDTISNIVSICEGQSYYFNGRYITKAGYYNEAYNCKYYKLVLQYKPNTDTIMQNATICQGENYYFYGENYSETGVYGVSRYCQYYVLNLTVTPLTDTVYEVAKICEGQQYYFDGQYYTESGSYEAQDNCTLTVLELAVTPPTDSIMKYAMICEGEHYYFHSNYYDSAGVYSVTTGCEVELLNLEFSPPMDTVYKNAAICEGGSYYFYDKYIDTPGRYVKNRYGCKVEVLTLEFAAPTDTIYHTDTICEGDRSYFNGRYYFENGLTYDYSGYNSCTVYAIDLTVKKSYNTTDYISIFEGQSYDTLTEPGNYYFVDTTTLGCDSIHRVLLSVIGKVPENVLPIRDTIYVRIYNSILVTVVDGSGSVLISEKSGTLEVKMYPNPVDVFINVSSENILNEIKIFDVAGNLLFEERTGEKEYQIDISMFNTGAYILSVNNEFGFVSKTFIIK